MNNEPRAWSLANSVIAALAGLILLLLSLGFYSINAKIENNDSMIMGRIESLWREAKGLNENVAKIQQDVVRIDTFQKIRLEKERIEQESIILKNRKRSEN